MKKINLALLFVLLIAGVLFLSCDSDSANPQTIVEYQITPVNQYITEITYNDKTGAIASVTDPAQFPGGKKSMAISAKPFTAKLFVTIDNVSVNAVNYTLVIAINGEIREFESSQVAAASQATIHAEYVVN